MKTLILILSLVWACPAFAQTGYYGGRAYTPRSFPRAKWCSCAMCQSLRAQWAASEKKVKANTESDDEYETKYKTETYQVKVCVNGRCYWETRTRKVPYRVKKKIKPEPDPTIQPVDLIPTPKEAVNAILDKLELTSSDTLVDAGCGDGRFLIEAAKRGARAIGVELDPAIVKIARENVTKSGEKAVVFQGDALEWNYSGATVVVIFQMQDLTNEIAAKIPEGVRVVSYMHDIKGVETKKHRLLVNGEEKQVFIGVVGRASVSFGL